MKGLVAGNVVNDDEIGAMYDVETGRVTFLNP